MVRKVIIIWILKVKLMSHSMKILGKGNRLKCKEWRFVRRNKFGFMLGRSIIDPIF